MKTLGRIAYESTFKIKGMHSLPWKDQEETIRIAYERIARAVEDAIFKRQQKRIERDKITDKKERMRREIRMDL